MYRIYMLVCIFLISGNLYSMDAKKLARSRKKRVHFHESVNIYQQYNAAYQQLEQHNLNEAEKRFLPLSRQDGNEQIQVKAQYYLGFIQYAQKKYDLAEHFFKLAARQNIDQDIKFQAQNFLTSRIGKVVPLKLVKRKRSVSKKPESRKIDFEDIEHLGWIIDARSAPESRKKTLIMNIFRTSCADVELRDSLIYEFGRINYHERDFCLAKLWWNRLSKNSCWRSDVQFFLGILQYNEGNSREAKELLKDVQIHKNQKEMQALTKKVLDKIKKEEDLIFSRQADLFFGFGQK